MTNGGPIIQAQDLRKRYGDRVAVDGVSITVNEGEIVGLLGPNGAGKTTTLSMLSGVIAPDTGWVSIAGHDLAKSPRKARERLGLVPQSLALYPTLTAIENLMFFGRMEGLSSRDALHRATGLLEEVGLSDRSEDMVGDFSGGTQLWAAPLKIAGGTLLTAAICLPSLYVLACLGGAHDTLRLRGE